MKVFFYLLLVSFVATKAVCASPITASNAKDLSDGFYIQVFVSSSEKKIQPVAKKLIGSKLKQQVAYIKENDLYKVILGQYTTKEQAEKTKVLIADDYPDSFIIKIQSGKILQLSTIENGPMSWVKLLQQHMNRCWTRPKHVSSGWSAQVSMKVSPTLYIQDMRMTSCDGSREFCQSIDETIDRCLDKKLPKPSKPEYFNSDFLLQFG